MAANTVFLICYFSTDIIVRLLAVTDRGAVPNPNNPKARARPIRLLVVNREGKQIPISIYKANPQKFVKTFKPFAFYRVLNFACREANEKYSRFELELITGPAGSMTRIPMPEVASAEKFPKFPCELVTTIKQIRKMDVGAIVSK